MTGPIPPTAADRAASRRKPLDRRYVALALALLLAVVPCRAAELSGRVVGVLDGDTIELLTPAAKQVLRVRLAGIDAPEKKQAYGAVAKRMLSDLVYAREVAVEPRGKDRYGRIVGKVVHDGMDIDLTMIEVGMAWHLASHAKPPPPDHERYAAAERDARAKRIGLWRDANPVPPWEFRRAGSPYRPEVRGHP